MIGITAQVSLYPLRQESLSPAIDEALQTFREHGLSVESGAMSSVISGDDTAIFAALQEAFRRVAEQGQVVMVVTFSNACPTPGKPVPSVNSEPVLSLPKEQALSEAEGMEKAISYRAIGHIENEFDEPLASDKIRAVESRIILDPALTEGLQGLEPGQRVMVIFYFHRSQGYDLRQHPRGDQSRLQRGVFALRSPRRPNPIGVTVVELMAVEENVLRVRGLDAINGTPVLDLKPA